MVTTSFQIDSAARAAHPSATVPVLAQMQYSSRTSYEVQTCMYLANREVPTSDLQMGERLELPNRLLMQE